MANSVLSWRRLFAEIEARLFLTGMETSQSGDGTAMELLDIQPLEDMGNPLEPPALTAHKGVAIDIQSIRNTGQSRNRDMARMEGEVLITMLWKIDESRAESTKDALETMEKITRRLTDIGWRPRSDVDTSEVCDQITFGQTEVGYHPSSRAWLSLESEFSFNFDMTLGPI